MTIRCSILLTVLLLRTSFSEAATPTFVDISNECGIDFLHDFGEEELTNLLQTTGPGVSLADVDGDGDLDIYLPNHAPPSYAEGQRRIHNSLYLNNGDGTFVDFTDESGTGDTGVGMGAVFGDYDNDGDLDLYLANYGPNVLFRNLGGAKFERVENAAGAECPKWSASAAWADVDNDGFLDLFVSNYLNYETDNQPTRSMLSYKEGYRFFPGPYDFPGSSNSLFRNRGDGTFEDITEDSGIYIPNGKGMGCSFSDIDLDGDQDLIVACDRTANFVFINDGTGHFEETGVLANIAYDMNGFDSGAMGISMGDIDGDIYPDLFITNMIFEHNALFQNLKNGTFRDVAQEAGIAERCYQYVAWGSLMSDFDMDGRIDCFVANGHVQDYIDTFSEAIGYEQTNQIFHNLGNREFADVTLDAGEGMAAERVSRGCAAGDLNGDGLPELVVMNSRDRPQILLNTTEFTGNWVQFRLQGEASNRSGVGARIIVRVGEQTIAREITAGDGYASQSQLYPRFGIGSAELVDSIEIRWPAGGVDFYESLPSNSHVLAMESQGLKSLDGETLLMEPLPIP